MKHLVVLSLFLLLGCSNTDQLEIKIDGVLRRHQRQLFDVESKIERLEATLRRQQQQLLDLQGRIERLEKNE